MGRYKRLGLKKSWEYKWILWILILIQKVPSLSAVSLSALFFWNQLRAPSEGYVYVRSLLHQLTSPVLACLQSYYTVHTCQQIFIAVGLTASVCMRIGGGNGFLLLDLWRWNLAELGPSLLSLFEYTAAMRNLTIRMCKQITSL